MDDRRKHVSEIIGKLERMFGISIDARSLTYISGFDGKDRSITTLVSMRNKDFKSLPDDEKKWVLKAVSQILSWTPYVDFFASRKMNACPSGIDNPYWDLTRHPQFHGSNGLDLWKEFCWGIVPSSDDAKKIAEFSPLVEIGAGSGYWAYLISQHGATIHAYDKFIPKTAETKWARKLWYDVKQGGPEVAREYTDPWTLLLIRPPSDEHAPMAKEILKNFKGKRFIYAGEVCGSNANKSFFDYLYGNFTQAYSRKLESTGQFDNFLKVFTRRKKPVNIEICDEHMVNPT